MTATSPPRLVVLAGRVRAWHTAAPVLAAAGAAALVVLRDPHVPGLWPTCPWLAMTGTSCPACGAMRGLERLVHGDVVAAIGHNALLVPTLAVLAWGWLTWATDRHPRFGRWPALPRPRWLPRTVALLVAIFWVARNLPALQVLAPS